jgi:hypothetical protein
MACDEQIREQMKDMKQMKHAMLGHQGIEKLPKSQQM